MFNLDNFTRNAPYKICHSRSCLKNYENTKKNVTVCNYIINIKLNAHFYCLDFQFNVNHYNCLIEVYLENEKDFSPTEILSEMLNNNIQPNTLTYENLLNYYCRKGQMSDANKILQYFKEKQIPVTEKIFSALIIGNAEAK